MQVVNRVDGEVEVLGTVATILVGEDLLRLIQPDVQFCGSQLEVEAIEVLSFADGSVVGENLAGKYGEVESDGAIALVDR